jgi:hypothetical protein
MQKLYCYVDETGQDTKGALFFVSVVIVGQEREQLIPLLETLEHETGKQKRKWSKSRPGLRHAYIRRVLREESFIGKLYYHRVSNTQEYTAATIQATAQAIKKTAPPIYKATILVDGLSRTEERSFARGIRAAGVHTEKIRGATDEADAFIRLADAVCGFIREAEEGDAGELRPLLERAVKEGYITRV